MSKYENFGPRNELAQTWTPIWLAKELWKGLETINSMPKPTDVVYDLAAGNGRLVDVGPPCRYVLNDIDTELCEILKAKFPKFEVHNTSFVDISLPAANYIIGSPPWMIQDGLYLPDEYIDTATQILNHNGLLALVIPAEYIPNTTLSLVYEYIPSQTRIQNTKWWKWADWPSIRVYQNCS